MKSNILLEIAYDGTGFLGWQKTKMGPSIEETLQMSLEKILQEPISLQAASRTDAGVHASGQIVNFFTEKPSVNMKRLKKSLNALLPNSIRVTHAQKMDPSFHPTLDMVKKIYTYDVCFGSFQDPKRRLYSWHVNYPLNIEEMKQGAHSILGEHDFSAFCNSRKQMRYVDKKRTLLSLDVFEMDIERLQIELTGDKFLYKMVRNLVGTLVYVGRGKIKAEAIRDILNSKCRANAGITAPAHGLNLKKVIYESTI